MKIAIVSFRWEGSGGAETVSRRLASQLHRLGHELIVVTTRREAGLVREVVDGIVFYRFRPWNLYWVGEKDAQGWWRRAVWQLIDTWNPQAYRVVKRILEAEQPDLVHVHKLRGLSPSVWKAASDAGIRVILQTCHDFELVSPVGDFGGWVGRLARGRNPLLWPYRALRARASRRVVCMTAPSLATMQEIVGYGFFGAAKRVVVPNPHDLTRGEVQQRSAADLSQSGRARMLYLGRLETVKGIDLLLDAMAHTDADLELVIAGWGSRESAVRSAAGRDERIRFVGKIGGEEKERVLGQADALVVPSLWPEVFGLVVVEAYARGVPVIASNRGALPELVTEGGTGWLFRPENGQELVRRLEAAARAPGELRAMRGACLKAALGYTVESVASAYDKLYAEQIAMMAADS